MRVLCVTDTNTNPVAPRCLLPWLCCLSTDTNIQIPQQPDAGSNPPTRTVEVSGHPQGCEAARGEIEHLVATHQANRMYGGGGGGA